MSRVTEDAEECNAIPTAKSKNKDTASAKSTFDDSVSGSSGEAQKKIHSFSKKLAKEIHDKKRKLNPNAKNACHETILLKYLANRISTSKHVIDEKKWFYTTIEKLAEQFPYFGSTTAYDLAKSLEKIGYLEIGNFNRYKYDRTLWFHVPEKVRHATEEDLVYFDAAVAKDVGIVSAVLQRNFEYWIGVHKTEKLDLEVEMSPARLAELLPFCESTIKRGLKQLESKYAKRLSDNKPLYGIIEINRGSNPNDRGSNPNDGGSYPNEMGSNPNDDTYWKTVSNPLETPSKPKPAASVFENPADAKKANDDKSHLFNDGMATCADEQGRKEMHHVKVAQPGSDFGIHLSSASSPETGQPRVFSFFDDPISCQKAEATPVPEVHAPSTADMADEVEHANGKWPMVDSLEKLHQINRNHANAVEQLMLQRGAREKFTQTIVTICAKTMGMLDASIMDELYFDPDGDEIIQELLPHFHQFLDQTALDPLSKLSQIIYAAALECMVGAFLWPREKNDSYSHPLHSLISVTRKFYLILWRRDENARLTAIEEERDQWREEFASVDEHKENDPSLSPAEKMRAFRNALHTRNKVGWIWFDQTHQTNRIQVSKLGCQSIQKLFELNPDLTPSDLLPVMDGCMKEYASRPAPPKIFKRGIHWHARMGHRLHIFASYLKTIVKQLGMASPVEVYLSEAEIEEKEGVALAA